MFKQHPLALFVAAFMSAGFADAGDTIRLGGQSADTHRLDLKASDRDKDVTEKACWFRGGYSYGYSSYYYGPSFSYYSAPIYSYYTPAFSYYAPPVYSYYYSPAYYSTPRFYSYSSPIVTYGDFYPMSLPRKTVEAPQPKSFRYDGGPAKPSEKIPPARLEVPPPVPNLPADPAVPKLGPSPVDMKVSLPAPAAKKKYAYPAYGEDRQPVRDDKTLLIRGAK